jgi:hypothetical protein
VDNENNPENIDQEMIVDAIVGSQEFRDDTAPPGQSQQLLVPLLFKIKLLSYSLFVVVPGPWAWGLLDFPKSKPPNIVSSPRVENER